jgi:hypothetical protein
MNRDLRVFRATEISKRHRAQFSSPALKPREAKLQGFAEARNCGTVPAPEKRCFSWNLEQEISDFLASLAQVPESNAFRYLGALARTRTQRSNA